ncbi:SAM-dependent methyltransferase [Helicobacter valdiviensis]|uniref:SAM-dependent methyltransferase n=1 Tax=Helicobacter valdiviensis TaxID=1458358 RepID=A0A2W6MVU8_9HELI|nr:50S ribosomal protein L11 methyltransferase [Helicobacter valdiviensis]PZT48644.1 SAM-dependent methyltransferase [Helicobacter valdiviensis]
MGSFSFGRNWKRFIEYVANDEIMQNAQDSLKNFFGDDLDFSNKVFLDIGCGSGIFSIAALNLGCKRVISIDVDSNSVEATQMAKEKFKPKNLENWEIFLGSILDTSLVDRLKKQLENENIILYSWGVLHHTGNLQLAMQNAMDILKSVRGGGTKYAYIALYNKTEASSWWLKKKKYYNKTNIFMKIILVFLYTVFLTFEDIRKGRGLNMYDKGRGMYKITDVIDWLGGMPYEPIFNDDVINFWEKSGFCCIKNNKTMYYNPIYPKGYFYKLFVYLKQVGLGCNEFLFVKK